MVKTNMTIMEFFCDNFSKFIPIYFKNQIRFFTLGDLLFIFLMSWWVILIFNSQKLRKNETFIGYIQRYDIDGEGCQSEVLEVTEEEDS